jgi:hypothetical protein
VSRAKPRGSHGDALFAWQPDGDVHPAEITTNPLTVACPTCHAGISEPCTRPSRRTGRTRLRAIHPARTDLSTGVST